MTKLMNHCSVDAAVRAGADPVKLGLVPVTLHNLGVKSTMWIPRGETVYVTAARTGLVANGHHCTAVETDANLRICEPKRESLGQATWHATGVVFDRKVSRLSFMDSMEDAVLKAAEVALATELMCTKLRVIREARKSHPILLKRWQEECRKEMLKRPEDRKVGRKRAKQIADERTLVKVLRYAQYLDTVMRGCPWDSAQVKANLESSEDLDDTIKDMVRQAVVGNRHRVPCAIENRFNQFGRTVVWEFKSLVHDEFERFRCVKMASAEGADTLRRALNNWYNAKVVNPKVL